MGEGTGVGRSRGWKTRPAQRENASSGAGAASERDGTRGWGRGLDSSQADTHGENDHSSRRLAARERRDRQGARTVLKSSFRLSMVRKGGWPRSGSFPVCVVVLSLSSFDCWREGWLCHA